MPKLGMGPVRRRQLVDATIASIHEFGLADTTITRIAKKAGVSPGIVHHYFADKDELLFETMRQMLSNLRKQAVINFAKAITPQQRLQAIVNASFTPDQFSPEVSTAWLALYASARKSNSLTRILSLYHRRLRSNLIYNLKQLDPTSNHLQAAELIAALIDGLYLRAAVNPSIIQQISPIELATAFIDHAISSPKVVSSNIIQPSKA